MLSSALNCSVAIISGLDGIKKRGLASLPIPAFHDSLMTL